ncbi:ATP-binding protein [Clostridium sp. ETTB3]
MKLKRLKIKRFRGYKDISVDFDGNINVIIGKNDIGKSTIMEALDIFFNSASNSKVKMEVNDLNIDEQQNKTIEITCVFEVYDDIVLDSTRRTSLEEEFLLNEKGLLEITKVWNCSKEKIGASDLKIYINAFYPNISDKPLINMKISELKKVMDSIKDEINNYGEINKTVSSDIRKCIYKYYIDNSCDFSETLIDISKEDIKDIWSGINNSLPMFFLFKSDRSNMDSDSEVQNPLKIATKSALKEIQSELDSITERIQDAVKTIGDNTIKKLQEMDADIASQLTTELNMKPWDSVFSFELIDGRGIPLNKRGSGVRRLMLLSYFRAEADRLMNETNKTSTIYAIEEPETAQHPDYQKMIIESFKEISNDVNHQIIITTHTPQIAKMVRPNQIIFIKRNENKEPCIINDENDKINGVIETLGILPDIKSKLVICVEGENDISFLKNISKLECFKDIVDLEKKQIPLIPMIGGNLKVWIDKNYFKDSNVKEFHIYDSDVDDYVKKVNEMNNNPDGRRWGINTMRLEMENYIPPRLIEETLKIEIEEEKKQIWSVIDVPELVTSKYGQSKGMKVSAIKSILNGRVAKEITKDSLIEIEAYEEIVEWFKMIKEISEE